MLEGNSWSLAALVLFGVFHGINPGMGWLFAVALGMQERSSRAVWRAMLPLALGHALAIGAAIMVALVAGLAVSASALRLPVAFILIALGVHRFFRHRHPRWARMRVGAWSLTLWSFLMGSAHGAGLMVLPIFLGMTESAHAAHAQEMGMMHDVSVAFFATGLHGAGYLAATMLLAWIVFQKLGLGLLRKAWLNLDLIWAFALVVTGVFSIFI